MVVAAEEVEEVDVDAGVSAKAAALKPSGIRVAVRMLNTPARHHRRTDPLSGAAASGLSAECVVVVMQRISSGPGEC